MASDQNDAILNELDELRRASLERQTELRKIAAQLPAEMSRRQLVKQMAVSVREAPDRATVVKRTLSKLARTPGDLVRAARKRS